MGCGVAAGVLVGLSDGNAVLIILGVGAAAAVALAAGRPALGTSAGLAAAIAALAGSHANDGSSATFVKAGGYGLAVAAVVVAAATVWHRAGRAGTSPARATVAVLIGAAVVGGLALPSPGVEVNGTTDRGAVANGMSPRTLNRIDAFLRDELRRNRIPGLGVAVVQRDRTLLERGYGVASPHRRPMTPNTPQIVASLSKSMTATAVATLVEAGKVHYDDPVQTYLPWFSVADPVASRDITVRQLLNQSSGFSTSSAWGALARVGGRSLETEVRSFRTVQLSFRPGHGYAYSNRNYQTLGMIVQAVSGEPFGKYLEEHVLRPAHMTSSFAAEYSPGSVKPARGFRDWFGVPVAMKQPFSHSATPSGSVYSTAHDLGLYLQSHLGRADLAAVSADTYATLHTPVGPYAMGWFGGRGLFNHGGHAPGATSFVAFDPKANWGVALIVNQQELGTVTAERVGFGLVRIMYDGPKPVVATRQSAHVALGLLAALLVALFVRAVTTLSRWQAARWPRLLQLLGWGLLLPAALLVVGAVVPRSSGGWQTAVVYAPDIGLLWLGTAAGAFVVGVSRAATLVAARRQR